MSAATLTLKSGFDRFLHALRVPLINLGLICVGSLVFAIGMNAILIPGKLMSGGILGLSILVHYLLFPGNLGLIYLLFNIPLALLGWFYVSKRFMVYTFAGIVIFSFMANVIRPPIPKVEDPILVALLAGVICGFGVGLILRSLGSTGGLDILAIYLNKRFGFRIGTLGAVFNIVILLLSAFYYDFELSLYSIIYVYTCSWVVDRVLTGFNHRKSLIVISDKADWIAREILTKKERGVTFLKGQGAFSGQEKKVIFTITALTELPKLKQLIGEIDPDAFMVINDTLEVLGRHHGSGRIF